MRPLILSMQAFGPYAGNQVVDFNELGRQQFFLIHGPTGAGKTTILDAMCFALYGASSGAEREAGEMRSDHADPLTPTEVTFDFACGKNVYRVRRRPKQERPKKRGDGTTTDEPQAALWQLNVDQDEKNRETVLASQWERVTEKVEEILGFKSSQFRQVVMLPQGQFRQLLSADSRERQKILETLFHTEIYRIMEDRLKEKAKEIGDEIKDVRRRIDLVLEQSGVASPLELADKEKALETVLHEQEVFINQMRQEETAAQATLNEGIRIVEKIEEQNNAQKDFQTQEERKNEFAGKRLVMEDGRRALNLVDVEEALQNRKKEWETLSQAIESMKEQSQTADEQAKRAEAVLLKEQGREPEREAALRIAGELAGLKTKVAELEQSHEELRKADVSRNACETQRQAAIDVLHSLRKGLEEKIQAQTEAAGTTAQTPALRAAHAEAERRYQQRRQLEEAQNALTAAMNRNEGVLAKRQTAEQSANKLREEIAAAEHLWQAGQAAVLAQGLIAGKPCPVCGSREHPAPALSDTPIPEEQELKKKRVQLDKHEQELAAIRDAELKIRLEVERHKANAALIKASLGDAWELPLSKLEIRLGDARKALSVANEAQDSLKPLSDEIEILRKREAERVRKVEETDSAYREAVVQREKWAAVCAEREAGIPEPWRAVGALEAELKKAAAQVNAMKDALNKAQEQNVRAREITTAVEATLREKESALNALEQAVQKDRETFQGRLGEAGFADKPAFQAAKRSAREIKRLEEEIHQFDQAREAAKDRAERAMKASEGLVAPDIENLTGKIQAVKENLTALMGEQSDRNAQIKLLDTALKNLVTLSSRLEKLEERFAVFGRISEVANGKNNYGITFQRFVLAALLDDVLTATSVRLKIMSRGRYELHRIRDKSKRPSGLELEVYDAYTGTLRGVATLSGGESFLASLALALGLADVVQSYAGGIHLDTIFIDEGFGSLDPEALEQAMRALIDLQKGGRLVGVISHVPEMKEWIPARLEITAGRQGSEARFVLE